VHEADTTNEVLLLAMTKPAPKLADVMPAAPPALALLVDKALEFERDDRWASASLMQLATRDALLAARELEGAKTLVGTPSPFDLASAKDKGGDVPAPVSATAMTETSEVSLIPNGEPAKAPERDPKEAKTELPIIQKAKTPKRTYGRGIFLFMLATGGLAAMAFANRSRIPGFGEISAEQIVPDSGISLGDAEVSDGVSTPLVGGEPRDGELRSADAGDDSDADADVDDDDGGLDMDEEEDEPDAGKAALKRPSSSPVKKKGLPTKHRTHKKRR